MDLKNKTPSKSNIRNKVLSNQMSCDSPLRLLPNISTPPSRFAKILNPFESHILDRLHLPTFSPSVFAQVSTPKNEEKFKWTIDDISSLKPADIDEATLSQHVSERDPTIESLVQEKIDKFFNEKAIVPSPFTEQVKQVTLLNSSPLKRPTQTISVQTLLSLPPCLPKDVEDVLAPYFTHSNEPDENSSLYRKLFGCEEDHSTPASSPALSTGLSPIQFSPDFSSPKRPLEGTMEMPELRDCTLSPIGRSPQARSACRLSFSGHMSVDASVVAPERTLNLYGEEKTPPQVEEVVSDSSAHWDMEYKQVSILSRSPLSSPEVINSSNSNTPHSKIFTSQRKRLSDSFKDEEFGDIEMDEVKRSRNTLRTDVTDGGYYTGVTESSTHMFASTPTKFLN